MGFEIDKFMATQFLPREDVVNVPDLKQFFDDKEFVWKVRGLKGVEIAKAREASQKNKVLKAVVDGIVSDNEKKKAKAIKSMLGVDGKIPDDIAYRIECLVIGSIEPVVDYPLATKLCETFPIEFYDITNKIVQLSGKGHEPGKAQASGKTKKSKQP